MAEGEAVFLAHPLQPVARSGFSRRCRTRQQSSHGVSLDNMTRYESPSVSRIICQPRAFCESRRLPKLYENHHEPPLFDKTMEHRADLLKCLSLVRAARRNQHTALINTSDNMTTPSAIVLVFTGPNRPDVSKTPSSTP